METSSLEARIRAVIAETTGAPCATPLVDAPLDSLTLVAIVARIEALFGIAFDTDETVALLGAPDASALACLIARKVGAQSNNLCETAGNECCGGGHEPP